MKEMWDKTTDVFSDSYDISIYKTGPAIVGWWWAFWISKNIFENISNRIGNNDEIFSDYTSLYFAIFLTLIAIVAAATTITMIRNYSKMETLLYKREHSQ